MKKVVISNYFLINFNSSFFKFLLSIKLYIDPPRREPKPTADDNAK